MHVPKNSIGNLLFSGIIIHIALFFFCADLYFKSPILHGMTPYKIQAKPFAKRLVLFIGDGLRAESIYLGEYKSRMPYITSLRENNSSWGVVHTSVPTETRPGHASILGGIYEDPSAIFTGWQANINEFDTLINESNYAWVYGSPDIVYMFPKHDDKLTVDAYDAEYEDFSGKSSTILLDDWVFNKISEVLIPKTGSCYEREILGRYNHRKLGYAEEEIVKEKGKCNAEFLSCSDNQHKQNACEVKYNQCVKKQQDEFNEITSKLENETHFSFKKCNKDIDELYENGNLFVLHLLGMDTVGHVHKPNSKEYVKNLQALDVSIRKTVDKFSDFYNDDGTVFVFTSDHGMTNWGSHGDGSDDETEVPYVIWGSGVKTENRRIDIQQADITSLMAVLIGIPIPTNSLGLLPSVLLKGTKIQILQAEFNNFKQLAEQYFVLKNDIKKDYFYEDAFEEDFKAAINFIEVNINNVDLIENNRRYMKNKLEKLMDAIDYIKNYYFKPKITSVIAGFLMWMIYLVFSMYTNQEVVDRNELNSVQDIKFKMLIFIKVLLGMLYVHFILISSSLITYFYPLFPFLTLHKLVHSENFLKTLQLIMRHDNKIKLTMEAIKYILLIQLLVMCFFNKAFLVLTLFILILWSASELKTKEGYYYKIGLGICFFFMSFFVIKGLDNYHWIQHVGSALWIAYYCLVILSDGFKYLKKTHNKNSLKWKIILATPLILFSLSYLNLTTVNNTFKNGSGVFYVNKLISWILSAASLFIIPMTSTRILMRFHQICACLMIPYALTSVDTDILFYKILTACLYFWIHSEACVYNSSSSEKVNIQMISFSQYSAYNAYIPSYSDYKKTYFYLALTTSYFLLMNLASFNGFDPMWTKAYVSVFNPMLMGAIIIWKLITPFFTITTAFYAINITTRANPINIFTILMLFLDQMVLNFMFFIKNKGSWKEIGTSISHFVIMEFMAVIMLIFYGLVKYVSSYKSFKFLLEDSVNYKKDDGRDNYSINISSKLNKRSFE